MPARAVKIGEKGIKKYILNEKIKSKEVRLIKADGEQAGVVTLEFARSLALQEGLDLMLVSDTAVPPVCKLVDFGQFKYQQAKRDKLQKKGTKSQVTKELKVGHKISDHDYQVKLAKGREFLAKRYKLKITVMFRGREIMHIDLGRNIIMRYIQDVKDLGTGDDVVQSGKSLGVMINPK